MSVKWREIHAISMPAALTQRAASTAHVKKALRVMDSTVQVKLTDELIDLQYSKRVHGSRP